MHFLYNIFIRLYCFFLWVASAFHPKARLWIKGRRKGLEKIALELDHEADHVWFHCASLGEFEQGRPVIEKFKKENPHLKIVLTFYSPSGYEMRKNYPLADHVFYMPLDTPYKARRFVQYVQPRMAIFVKYEYWFNHLAELEKQNIPVVFISAIFRKNQMFFKWWGSWFRKRLSRITYFFVQDKKSQELLYSIGIKNTVVSGDTRFDRVFAVSQSPARFEKIEKFVQASLIVVAGSSWPADDRLMLSLINQGHDNLKYILVPHEINTAYIEKLTRDIHAPVVKYSHYSEEAFKHARVLIIDQIGMLSSIYQYASLAYVGGGFGKGIHNILEAATFGMPVVFGPRYQKFTEARELIALGGAFPVKDKEGLLKVSVALLGNYDMLKKSSDIAKAYVHHKKGATDKILVFLNAMINPAGFKSQTLDVINMN